MLLCILLQALYYAALVLWHIGRNDKAREYVDKILKMAPTSLDGMLLRAWIDLTSTKENYSKKANRLFEEVLSKSDHPKPIDALLGHSHYLMNRHNFSGALDVLNEAIVTYQNFLPAFLEKMKVQVAMREWEQAVETAQRSLIMDINCIEAHKTLVLNMLANEGRVSEAATKIGELIHLVDRFEPKNHALYYSIALPLARLSCRNLMVLHQTSTLLERAQSLHPRHSPYVTEAGYQWLLRGSVKEALATYQKAFTMDETSVEALAGIIHCQILQGQLEEAEQQLEFLNEVRSSLGKVPELLYLGALLASAQRKSSQEIVSLIDEAAQIHFASLNAFPVGSKFFHLLNPDFVLQMTKLMLLQAPMEPIRQGEPIPSILSKCTGLLEPLSATAPGIPDTFLVLARVRFLSGEMESSQSLLQQCLDHTPGLIEAHLLMAQVHLHRGNYRGCTQVLEIGLSHNFEVGIIHPRV
jgi:tetratricopeptide repeat protein 21B